MLTRFSYGKKQLAWLQEHHDELMEKAKKVEQQNIDPELEYEIANHMQKIKPVRKNRKSPGKINKQQSMPYLAVWRYFFFNLLSITGHSSGLRTYFKRW